MAISISTAVLSEAYSAESAVRIVCIGDSITKGVRPATGASKAVTSDDTFCAHIGAMFREKGVNVEVFNAGVGSDRTDGALKRLDADVLAHKPQIVTIMFGTNDSVYDIGKRGPRLSIKTYEKNLREIVSRVRAAGAEAVIMTEPVMASRWLIPERNKVYAEKGLNYSLSLFMEATRRVASEMKTPLVDNFAQWEKLPKADVEWWLPDGVHPDARGHEVISKNMMKTLAPMVESMVSSQGK